MPDEQRSESSLEVKASGLVRWSAVYQALLGVYFIAVQIGTRSATLRSVNVVLGCVVILMGGWSAFNAGRGPVLRFGADEIRWRGGYGRTTKVIPLAAVTGYRWDAPMDLWLYRTEGAPEPLPVGGISRKDRERVRAWVSARWPGGGSVGRS